VTSTLGRTVLAITDQPTVRKVFTESRPGRALSTRFVAGESIDDAVAAARALNQLGAEVSLDHLGEHVTDKAQAERARDDYLACLDRIGVEGIDGNISVKLTQLGLGTDDDLAAESLGALASRAGEVGTSVSVDMEESLYTEATVTMFEQVQAAHGNLGLAVQAYLKRTPRDLDRIIAAGGHVRLCKGAYAESPDLAYQARAEVNAAFDRLTRLVMGNARIYPAIATHDDDRIALATELGRVRTRAWELQMLYGVRTKLQSELLAAGHKLRVYVPYGSAWYPYLTRRLAERPANLWFFLRAAANRS
jgi:proline dehydrogenase